MAEARMGNLLRFRYRNHRGELVERAVVPHSMFFGRSDFHEGNQWLLRAFCVDRQEFREFAVRDIEFGSRDRRQGQVAAWCAAAFGTAHLASLPQRGIRLLEEAVETAQAAGCKREMCHKLIDYVFDREPGELVQEIGGVGLTLLALCAAAGVSADDLEQTELERVLAKPLDHFAARNKVKNDAGFNVEDPAP